MTSHEEKQLRNCRCKTDADCELLELVDRFRGLWNKVLHNVDGLAADDLKSVKKQLDIIAGKIEEIEMVDVHVREGQPVGWIKTHLDVLENNYHFIASGRKSWETQT